MRRPYSGTPSPGWRQFLTLHSAEIWACDLFTVQTVWFQTLYVFFVIHHGTRELIHARVTAHPNSKWLAQQMVEACGISREPPRYLIHDRDGCFGASFNRRVASLGIRQIRTPVKAPKANAIAERWVRTIRYECLDHRLIFGHHHCSELLMNTSLISIVGDLIEVLVSQRHVRMLGRYRENRPGISDRNRFSAGCIMCINGQHDNTDGVFAPYTSDRVRNG